MEPIKQIAADDWTDQDLLTRDEAGVRLDQEIAEVIAELAKLRYGGAGSREQAGAEMLARRLKAMKAARAELKGPAQAP